MSKIAVLGLIEERSELLKSLMELGVVEIIQEKPSEDIEGKAYNPNVQVDLSKLDSTMSGLSRALVILNKYVPLKKPMFSARKIVSEADYSGMIQIKDKILACGNQINDCEDEITKLKSEESRINGLLTSLNPWLELDIPLHITNTRYTFCYTGSLPGKVDLNAFKESIDKEFPESFLSIGKSDREHHFLAVIAHQTIETEVMNFLRGYGWNRITLREVEGNAKESKARFERRLEAINEEREENINIIKGLANERERLQVISDSYQMERSRIDAKSRLISTGSTFMLKGWIPSKLSAKVSEYLNKYFFCAIEIEEPLEDEEFPVLIKNGPIVESMAPVLSMYGVPSCREIDPSAVMMPFYILFFGLMLGDGGYGLLIAIFTGFVLKRYRLEDSTRRFMKLLFFCGLSTIFAGFLFGSWFGISSLTKTALWIVPTEQPELMMSYSILFGIIHMYAGLFLKALNLLRHGKILDAVFDVFFVYILNTGLILSLLTFAPGIDTSNWGGLIKVGNYLFIAGIALTLLTQGRHSKSIFGKIFGGLPKLYDIISFFSDCLSYTRILALGLASAIIGDIVNTMALSFGNIFVKVIAGGIILFLGHVMNFALNALGAYVHSCRLQFLEFFGKFLEGGGVAFKPLEAHTKYIIVNTETSQFLTSGSKAGVA